MQNQDKIDDFIFQNLEHLREKISSIKKTRDRALKTDPLFSDLIREQYRDRVKGEVSLEICINLGCSFEDVMIRLEELKVETILE